MLIALLRESGYSASFVFGTMFFRNYEGDQNVFYNLDDLGNWLGLGAEKGYSVEDVGRILADAGIPFTVSNLGIEILHVWVKTPIESKDVFFNPSFKTYSYKSKIDIAQVLGYDKADLLAAARQGSVRFLRDGQIFGVRGVNEARLREKLVEYSTKFVNSVRAQPTNGEIGRRDINQIYLPFYSDQLYSQSPYNPDVLYWDEIPSGYIATLRIQLYRQQLSYLDEVFPIPTIASKRLTLTFPGFKDISHPVLHLDGVPVVVVGPGTVPGLTFDLILTIDHPYSAEDGKYADQSATYSITSGSSYAILSGFGDTAEQLISKRHTILANYQAQKLPNDSESILGETLNIIGLNYLKAQRMMLDSLAPLSGDSVVKHHFIGLVSQESSYYIDFRNIFLSIAPGSNRDQMSSFLTYAFHASAEEHGVLEQLMGRDIPAVSTIKLLQVANANRTDIYLATNATFAHSIRPGLVNYSSAELDRIASDLADDPAAWVILPRDGNLSVGHWKGSAFILNKASDASAMTLKMTIAGNVFGGYATEPGMVNDKAVQDNSYVNITLDSLAEIDNEFSKEPVDMATGAFYYTHSDLTLGLRSPLGLSFSRTYNSGQQNNQTTLGYGWTHNNNIYLRRISHPDLAFGARSSVDAAALVTAYYISLDLLRNGGDLFERMVSVLISKWAIDQLTDTAVIVHLGDETMEFVKLPDGTYASPPGMNAELVRNADDTFLLKERFGSQMLFNANNQIQSFTDVDQNTTTFAYSDKNLTSVQDAFGRTLTLTYADGLLRSVADSAGRSVVYGYDTNANLITYTDPEGKIWQYGYDADHRMTSLKNPLGIITVANTYDALGRVNTQDIPRQGGTATYKFYFPGSKNVEEDPYGKKTSYYLDTKGRVTVIENALGHQTQKRFDDKNRVIEVTDLRGNTTRFTYDASNNMTSSENPLGLRTIYSYDEKFRLISITDPLSHSTSFRYDANHHVIRVSDGEGNEHQFTYYSNGLLQTMTDGRGITTTITYDNYGNRRTVSRGAHAPVTYMYDAIGRMIALTDNVGSTTTFAYDKRGLLVRSTDPLGKTTSYTYDDAGRLMFLTDRKNATIQYSYTLSDQVARKTYPDSSTVTFTYDLNDNLTVMQDAIGTTKYTYDDIHRLLSVEHPYNLGTDKVYLSYFYDDVNNRLRVNDGGPFGTRNYYYDQLNRLTAIEGPGNQKATYAYDNAGRLVSLENFNKTTTAYGYDRANRLIAVENRKSNGDIIATYNYTLDANGNRIKVVQNEPLTPLLRPETKLFKLFTYNQANNRLLTAGSSTFQYDNEGQLSGKDATSYIFNYDHLLAAIKGVSSVQYSYDGRGNRQQAVHDGAATVYFNDPAGNLIMSADKVFLEFLKTEYYFTSSYIHGLGLLAASVFQGNQNHSLYYHYDGNGNTVAVTDENQNIINTYAYSSYGLVLEEHETVRQPFKYAGKYGVMKDANGLYYMRARYYDAEVGRFISEDPIGFATGNVNMYSYALDNPMKYVDSRGLGIDYVADKSLSADVFKPSATSVYIRDLIKEYNEDVRRRNAPRYYVNTHTIAAEYPTLAELDRAIRNLSYALTPLAPTVGLIPTKARSAVDRYRTASNAREKIIILFDTTAGAPERPPQ